MIRITLRGRGGELDSMIVDTPEAINEAIKLLADSCIFSVGDAITIEEIEECGA